MLNIKITNKMIIKKISHSKYWYTFFTANAIQYSEIKLKKKMYGNALENFESCPSNLRIENPFF